MSSEVILRGTAGVFWEVSASFLTAFKKLWAYGTTTVNAALRNGNWETNHGNWETNHGRKDETVFSS